VLRPADLVEHPSKVMRIGSMIKQLLEEVRSAPLDEAGRTRLAEIHRRSISELEQGLAPELIDELAGVFGAQRVVFGTDLYSHPVGRRISHLLPQIVESSLSHDDKAAILGGNARRLFGLG